MAIFRFLSRSKVSAQVKASLVYIFNVLCLYRDGLSVPRPTPKQWIHPLSAVGDYLIRSQVLFISGDRLLYLQPHDASWGDNHPLIADSSSLIAVKSTANNKWLRTLIWTRRDSSDNGRCLFLRRPVPQGYPHVRECDLTMVRRPASSQLVPRDRSKPRVLSHLFPRNSVLPTNQVNCRDPTSLRVTVQGTNHVKEGALRCQKQYSAILHKINLMFWEPTETRLHFVMMET